MIDYKPYLKNELNNIFEELGLDTNYRFYVENERMFIEKMNDEDFYFEPNAIYVVIKYMRGQYYVDSTEIPIVIYAFGEENSLDVVKMVFNIFGQKNNLKPTQIEDDNKLVSIKQTFSTPTISDNFLQMGSGFRTMITMSGNISVYFESNDVEQLMYYEFDDDGDPTYKNDIEIYRGTLAYVAQPDPQPSMNKKFIESEYKTASCSLVLELPFYNEKSENSIVSKNFYKKILKCMAIEKENDEDFYTNSDYKEHFIDKDGLTQNASEPFYFKIVLKSRFVLYYRMLLNSCTLVTDKGGLPTFNVSFGM